MSETQHDRTAGPGAPSGDWWNRRPYRSTNDRKIAGVAGGLGRAFGVDPVLIRVGFVVLAALTWGAALLAYPIAWFLMPEEPAPAEPVRRDPADPTWGQPPAA